MDASVFLRKVEASLSEKDKKRLKKLSSSVGRDNAVALLGMHSRTSAAEIEMISEIMASFEDVRIFSVRHQPRNVVFEGEGAGFKVRLHPQYVVGKPVDHPHYSKERPQDNYWYIDFAIELGRYYSGNWIRAAVVAIEYNGHIAHYVESNIRKSYMRDWGVFDQCGYVPLKVTPEHWRNQGGYFMKSINRHLKHHAIDMIYWSREFMEYRIRNQLETPDFVVQEKGGFLYAVPTINLITDVNNNS